MYLVHEYFFICRFSSGGKPLFLAICSTAICRFVCFLPIVVARTF